MRALTRPSVFPLRFRVDHRGMWDRTPIRQKEGHLVLSTSRRSNHFGHMFQADRPALATSRKGRPCRSTLSRCIGTLEISALSLTSSGPSGGLWLRGRWISRVLYRRRTSCTILLHLSHSPTVSLFGWRSEEGF